MLTIDTPNTEQNQRTDAPPKPGRKRSVARHRAILTAAAELVTEIGYDAVTIEAIAVRAGCGKQTIYRWWSSRAALMAEAYKALVPPAALTSNAQRVEIRLFNLLSHLFDLYAKPPTAQILAGLICDAQRDRVARTTLHHELIEGRKSLLHEVFEEGVKAGELGAGFDIPWAISEVTAHIWYRLLSDPLLLDQAFAQKLARRACRDV